MKKCLNCGNGINEHRKYCSLTCRNIYVNKNLRDYTKNKKSIKEKYLDNYNQNPKICKNCGNKIDYKKRSNTFCGSSCNAKYNNPKRIGIKMNLSEIGIVNIRKATEKRLGFSYEKYYLKPNNCIECESILPFNKRKNKFCNKKCQNKYNRKHLTEYQKYYKDCKFKFGLKDYPNEFDFSLIEEFGWYKPKNHGNNLNGISRDHMLSVKEGFEKSIKCEIISHPANCKLMQQTNNSKKHKKSSIKIKDLNKKIELWNIKYSKI